jgi:hypothetical protein
MRKKVCREAAVELQALSIKIITRCSAFSDIWEFDLKQSSWERICPAVALPRTFHPSPPNASSPINMFLSQSEVSGRMFHAATLVGRRMIVLGGVAGDDFVYDVKVRSLRKTNLLVDFYGFSLVCDTGNLSSLVRPRIQHVEITRCF